MSGQGFKVGIGVSKNDLILIGAGIAAAAAVYVAFFRPAYGEQPPGQTADRVDVAVNPGVVFQGGQVGVTATFSRAGVPVVVPTAYMRVMSGGQVIDQNSSANVSSVQKVIDTTALPAGNYVVEVADNPTYT